MAEEEKKKRPQPDLVVAWHAYLTRVQPQNGGFVADVGAEVKVRGKRTLLVATGIAADELGARRAAKLKLMESLIALEEREV